MKNEIINHTESPSTLLTPPTQHNKTNNQIWIKPKLEIRTETEMETKVVCKKKKKVFILIKLIIFTQAKTIVYNIN